MATVSFAEVSVSPAPRFTLVLFRVDVIPRMTELLADRVMGPLKPCELVRMIVTFLFLPGKIERLVVLPLMLKSGMKTEIVNPKILLLELLLPELSCVTRVGLKKPAAL